MIAEHAEKIKQWLTANRADLFSAALIFLVGLGGFGLGRLSILRPEKQAIQILNKEAGSVNQRSGKEYAAAAQIPDSKFPITASRGKYVASKNGKYYHLPWCPGALRIKEQNKIWFQTRAQAESKGLKPAANCPGL